jgi:hypothetical protein
MLAEWASCAAAVEVGSFADSCERIAVRRRHPRPPASSLSASQLDSRSTVIAPRRRPRLTAGQQEARVIDVIRESVLPLAGREVPVFVRPSTV